MEDQLMKKFSAIRRTRFITTFTRGSFLNTTVSYMNAVYILTLCYFKTHFNIFLRPRHSSSGYSLASHRGGPGSNPGLVTWDL
jgi:hypothetical protein